MGDAQLIRLNTVVDEVNGRYVSLIETFSNLAPIIDMVVVEMDKQGQGQLITCSGNFNLLLNSLNDKSLRLFPLIILQL